MKQGKEKKKKGKKVEGGMNPEDINIAVIELRKQMEEAA